VREIEASAPPAEAGDQGPEVLSGEVLEEEPLPLDGESADDEPLRGRTDHAA
jgi:hypothetical protein